MAHPSSISRKAATAVQKKGAAPSAAAAAVEVVREFYAGRQAANPPSAQEPAAHFGDQPAPARGIAWIPNLNAHDAVMAGAQAEGVLAFVRSFKGVPEAELLMLIGIAPRSFQRLKAGESVKLSVAMQDRISEVDRLRLLASEVFGAADAAEAWLLEPAMALEGRRPLELLASSQGTRLVEDLLRRMDYGVYA